MWYLKIPKERVAVLIGTDGRVKRRIEGATGVSLDVDSKGGEVTIGEEETNPLMALKARDIVKAIGRGFSPERAMALLSDDIYLELIDIRHYTGKNQRRVREMRGRLIGRDGRTRQLIEEHSDVDLSIYGNTVAIIGTIESLEAAKHAVDMLLRGARHGTVYRYLERRKREMRKSEFRQLTTG